MAIIRFPDTRDYIGIANSYREAVLDGSIIACEYVKLACLRHQRDLEKIASVSFPYRFDEKKAARVCNFAERLPHIKGPLANQKRSIELAPWQIFIITCVFGWVKKSTGARRFTRVYESVARKNGKSTVMSAIALYMLVSDGEEGPEVYTLATSRDQAGIIWKDARAMIRKRPFFMKKNNLKMSVASIYSTKNNGSFMVKPGQPGDGDNPHFVVVDEFHEHKTSIGYDAMYNGMGAREQPLLWAVTTAGFDTKSPCHEHQVYTYEVLKGIKQDDSLFAIIYTLDPGDEWTDTNVWIKANPNIGYSVTYDNIAEACNEARNNQSKLNTFLTKRMNQWTKSGVAFFDMNKWHACEDKSLRLQDFLGSRAYIGLDLAATKDVAALYVMVQTDEGWKGFARFYLPKSIIDEHGHDTHANFALWAEQEYIILTPGRGTDHQFIEGDIEFLLGALDVQAIGFDAWQAHQLVTRLANRGAPVVQIANTVKNLSPAMKEAEKLLEVGNFRHDGNPCMTWMMSNVVAHKDNKGNVYPRKLREEDKIDGASAWFYALNRTQFLEEQEGSVYETWYQGMPTRDMATTGNENKPAFPSDSVYSSWKQPS